ncbi:MAG: recombinase family protein, partial [Clostridiales bacterium]|nr:recombinase family protein [Clostridiales bacterium]
VYVVLHNEMYTGTMVQGKRKKRSYRSKELTLLPKEEWIRVEGTHEAIVDPALFTLVQEVMKKETRVAGGKDRVHLLSGFLFCGVCGRQMTMQSTYHKGKKYSYYTCRDCRDGGRTSKRVSERKAYAAILASIREMAETAARVQQRMDETGALPEQGKLAVRHDRRMVQLQDELERCARLRDGLHEDYASGVLSREEYRDYAQMYSVKLERAKTALKSAEEEHKRLLAACREARWLSAFRQYRGLKELTRPVLARLVERVLVYEGGRMEIRFREADVIQATLEMYGWGRRADDDEAAAAGRAV